MLRTPVKDLNPLLWVSTELDTSLCFVNITGYANLCVRDYLTTRIILFGLDGLDGGSRDRSAQIHFDNFGGRSILEPISRFVRIPSSLRHVVACAPARQQLVG